MKENIAPLHVLDIPSKYTYQDLHIRRPVTGAYIM
jgi:hypothetical protein